MDIRIMSSSIDASSCRICSETAVTVISLREAVDGNSLADMLRYCVNLEIDQDDGLPYQCCTKCKHDLLVAHKLVIRCHQSDTKFRELLLETKSKSRHPPEDDLIPMLTEDDIKTELAIDEEDFDPQERVYADPLYAAHLVLDIKPTVKNEKGDKTEEVTDADEGDEWDDDKDEDYDPSNVETVMDDDDDDDIKEGKPRSKKKKTAPERCCRCRFKLTTMEEAREHSKTVHLSKRCTDPEKIAAKPFECDICFKRYTNKKAWRQHKSLLFIKNKFQCDQCDLSFRLERTLMQHKDSHNNVIQPYSRRKDQLPRCCACYEQFDTDELLKKHADEVHYPESLSTDDKSNQFPCDLCHRRYKSMRILREHQSKPYRVTQYQCATCGRTYRDKSALADHERSHQEERAFICPVCSKPFAMRDSFRKHVKAHSVAQDRFKCEICGKGFKARANLKCHLITHNPQHRPILCTLCPATFARKICLQAHMKLHTGEKPYKCDQCDAAYTFATDLKRHIMAHNGIKPYVCTICGRGYPRRDYLRKHMANHCNQG
ncbi:zinc finger protein OZF-like [Ochlerotatus camptorhynchus]|uniref:zinc finger protein OZF-like n=1 Tax=Ochlerotatus camptorhynchus TaxID=644619 RepID=UPI0031CE8E87